MATAWLSLGANIGDPAAQLEEAIRRLDAHADISVTKRSAIVRTAPWGKTDQDDFLNIALEVETTLKPLALLEAGLNIETEMGRERQEVWGPRLIDIDVIAFERFTIKAARLTLPHPYAHVRDFVLDPLREISPETADWILEVAQRPQ